MNSQIPVELLVRQLQQIPGIKITVDDLDSETVPATFSPNVLFGDWSLYWLSVYKKGVVKDNTYNSTYREPIELHLIPAFGHRLLTSIRPAEVQMYFKSLSDKLSLETQKKIRNALKLIYETGIECGYCTMNPVTRSLKLTSSIPSVEKHTWTAEEYHTAFEFALRHPSGLEMIVLMETAISRSELLGLRWPDHDSAKSVLYIRNGLVAQKSTVTGKYELISDGLKNHYRQRCIPLSPLLNGLLTLKPRMIFIGGNLKTGQTPRRVRPEFIFHGPGGRAYDPNNWYRRVLKKFMHDLHEEHPEVPILTTHELRHTKTYFFCNLNQFAIYGYEFAQKILKF